MTANEQRAEIMRILVAKRSANIRVLAAELGVCRRTVCTAIEILIVLFAKKVEKEFSNYQIGW